MIIRLLGHSADRDLMRNIRISHEVTTPIGTQVQSQTGSGDQTIEDVADVTASTGSRDITGDDLRGGFTGRTGSGSIRMDGIGGAARAHTGSGDVALKPRGAPLFLGASVACRSRQRFGRKTASASVQRSSSSRTTVADFSCCSFALKMPASRSTACATNGIATASTIGTIFSVVSVCFVRSTARSPPEMPP
jgi:hypothetical protein